MTEDELREIETRMESPYGCDELDSSRLLAEVRRLRSLFTEEDAKLVERIEYEHAVLDKREEAAYRDLARRLREAIGHPPTDSETDDG